MKFFRLPGFWIFFALAMFLLASSCAPQRYPSHRKSHQKPCDCPQF